MSISSGACPGACHGVGIVGSGNQKGAPQQGTAHLPPESRAQVQLVDSDASGVYPESLRRKVLKKIAGSEI